MHRCCSRHTATTSPIGTTDPVDDDLFGDADVDRARPLRQPADRRGTDGAARRRVGHRRRRSAGRLRIHADAAPDAAAAGRALGVDEDEIRVVTPLVGGGFGGKAGLYPEQVVVAAAAKRLQRPGRVDRRRAAKTCWRCRTAAARSSTSSSAASATARSPACACAWSATAAPIPGIGCVPARGHAPDVQRHVSIHRHPVRRRRRRHQHHTDGRVPRRRPSRGDGAARADRRPGVHRAGHRPHRAAPAQPAGRRRLPVHHADRHHLRQRCLQHAARRGRQSGPATTSCDASRPLDAPPAIARCWASASRRTSRSPPAAAPASTAPCRCTTTAPPPSWPARRPTVRVTRPRSP